MKKRDIVSIVAKRDCSNNDIVKAVIKSSNKKISKTEIPIGSKDFSKLFVQLRQSREQQQKEKEDLHLQDSYL